MMNLIVYQGERMIVSDEALDGYPGAQLLATVDRELTEFEDIDEATGQIVLDAAREADTAELAEVTDRERLRQFVRIARQRILALEDETALIRQQATAQIQNLNQKVAALEARVTALKGAGA